MAKKIGILVVHGMGVQKDEHFADEMIAEVNQRVQRLGLDPDAIAWRPGFWANVTQPHEDNLWNAVSAGSDLDCVKIRKFVINSLGDAVAYQREPLAPDVYHQIHQVIHEHLVALRQSAGGQDVPLIIMAHSLGSYIMSNYLWDQQTQNETAIQSATDFEKMKTLAGMITFGSNIAVFSLALTKFVGVKFPSGELSEPLCHAARWVNYYDQQDVLGYPVKPLCADYRNNPQIEDRAINVGNLLTSWNPLSHNGYWTDDDFTKPVADQIAEILKLT